MKTFCYRFGFLALLLFAPYFLIWVLPGSFYPASYFRSLELIKLGAHHQDVDEVIEGVKLFQTVYPKNCYSYHHLGDLYTTNHEGELALISYRQAWEYGCLSDDGMLNLVYLEQDKPEQLEHDLSVWIKQNPKTYDELYKTLLNRYEADQRFQQAANLSESWVLNHPSHSVAWRAFYKYGPYFSVEKMREMALKMPLLNEQMDKATQGVIDAYVLSVGEDNDVAYYRLGTAYSNAGQWMMAEICFQKSIKIEADRTESWVNLAIAQKNQGKDSKKAIKEAEKRSGDNDIIRSLMGIYWRDSDPEIAYVYWMKLIANQPEMPEWRIEAGNSLAQMGDLEAAEKYYQQAIDLTPDRVDIRAAYARFCLLYDKDISSNGLQQTRAMIRLAPENIEGYLLEGQILIATADYVTAERMFLQALQLDANSPAANFFLGFLYQNTNEPGKAWQHLQIASQSAEGYYQRAAARLLNSP